MPRLSLIVITYNEAHNIERCLASVPFADEKIVMDSASTDDTVSLARQYTSKVYVTDWPGYGAQRNRALSKATGDWVLALDADEYLSQKAQQLIPQALETNDGVHGYELLFISSYCGHIIKWGDWRNDYGLCLFRREGARYTNDAAHEQVLIEGRVARLKAPINHATYDNLDQVINKINHYSSLTAQDKNKKGIKGSMSKALGHAFWKFFHGYVLRLGFLDGRAGLMLAISNAESTYYRYLKLAELQKNAPPR